MNRKKILLITSALCLSLIGLLVLLIHWAGKSVEYKDKEYEHLVNNRLAKIASTIEDSYYCFDLYAERNLQAGEEFYLMVPGDSIHDTLTTTIFKRNSRDTAKSYASVSFNSPISLYLRMSFEFDYVEDTPLEGEYADLKQFIKDGYKHYIIDKNRTRLLDTLLLDSLIRKEIVSMDTNINIGYQVKLPTAGDSIIYGHLAHNNQLEPNATIGLYESNKNVPPLLLELYFLNHEAISRSQLTSVIISSVFLFVVAAFLFAYLVFMVVQQKRLFQMKNDLVHSMTHEFNTPISNINLAVDTLYNKTEEQERHVLDIIKEENERLKSGISRILTIALIEDKELSLHLEEIDLHELIEKVASKAKLLLKNGEIKTQLAAKRKLLMLDRVHTANIIHNLLDNAIKYTGEKPLIEITTADTKNGVQMIFADNGKGIPVKEQGLVFDKFFRGAANNSSNTSGYGLGLYYVKVVIEALGGSINLKSSKDEGTAFTITFKQA